MNFAWSNARVPLPVASLLWGTVGVFKFFSGLAERRGRSAVPGRFFLFTKMKRGSGLTFNPSNHKRQRRSVALQMI